MRLQIIHDAVARCDVVEEKFGGVPPISSIRAQLRYLSDLATGRTTDRSRLSEIILGVQAAKEIESLDEPLATLLYEISADVDRMRKGKA